MIVLLISGKKIGIPFFGVIRERGVKGEQVTGVY